MFIRDIFPGDSVPVVPVPHRHVAPPPPPLTPQEKEKEKIARLLAEELEARAVAVAEEERIFDTRIKNTQDIERISDRHSRERSVENAKLSTGSSAEAIQATDEPR
jgi:hypothetical protein